MLTLQQNLLSKQSLHYPPRLALAILRAIVS